MDGHREIVDHGTWYNSQKLWPTAFRLRFPFALLCEFAFRSWNPLTSPLFIMCKIFEYQMQSVLPAAISITEYCVKVFIFFFLFDLWENLCILSNCFCFFFSFEVFAKRFSIWRPARLINYSSKHFSTGTANRSVVETGVFNPKHWTVREPWNNSWLHHLCLKMR